MIKRYLKLYLKSISFSVAQTSVYRTSFLLLFTWLFVDLIIKIIFFKAIFLQVGSIGGWSFEDAFLLLMFQGLFFDFSWMLFIRNLDHFSDNFSKGDFDFILLKPMNSLAYLTVTGFRASAFSGARFPFLFYAIVFMPYAWHFPQTISAIIVFLCGIIIMHAVFVIITTFVFWIIDGESIYELLWPLTDGARFPIVIFPSLLRFVFTFLIPIAFMANVPVMVLKQMLNPWIFVGTVFFAVFFEIIAFLFWQFGVKHYSSASS